ncbi:MAG: response regulator [Pseudomonadales bacterium]|nr:response regulator [Pseudomonadales bacterium]
MKPLSFVSIRNKLILIIFSVSMIVITVIGSVHFILDIQHVRKTMAQDLTSLTDLLGNRSSAALAFDISKLADENLASLTYIPNIIQACVYKKEGEVFSRYQRERSKIINCPKIETIQEIGFKFDDSQLYIVQDIFQQKLLLGKIYIASDLTPINTMLRNIGIFSAMALAAAALISFVLASWMQHFISKSIIQISRVAKSIEEKGDHSQRVKIEGNDEVAQLGGSFNEMLDALERQNTLMNRSKKMDALGQLTGGIAHDYNNMLGVILGYSELLEGALNDQPKLLKYASEISHAGERGAMLTKKLLSFSRGSQQDASSCDINSLLLGAELMLGKTLTVRVKLSLDLQEGLWLTWIDEGGLEDAILNFSINAMHAIEGSGQFVIQTRNQTVSPSTVNVSGLKPGDYVVLSFKDTGCGMDKHTQERVFEPFFTTKGEKGTGLGLSQAYGYVKQHGGLIKVQSQLGKGTIFTLYFPRYVQKTRNDSPIEQPTNQNEYTGNGTILLVDDEVALLNLSSAVLEEHGYTVIAVDSAEKALKILTQQTVDLLLSDVLMPEMDGYQLTSIVKDKYPDIKIQLVSGFSDVHNVDLVENALYENTLIKPVKSAVLLKRVGELLKDC